MTTKIGRRRSNPIIDKGGKVTGWSISCSTCGVLVQFTTKPEDHAQCKKCWEKALKSYKEIFKGTHPIEIITASGKTTPALIIADESKIELELDENDFDDETISMLERICQGFVLGSTAKATVGYKLQNGVEIRRVDQP